MSTTKQAIIEATHSPDDGGWWAEGVDLESGRDLRTDSRIYPSADEAIGEVRAKLAKRGYSILRILQNG